MADYRNAVDLQNAKDLSFGGVKDTAETLARMLQAKDQLAAQQQFDLNKQDREAAIKQQGDTAKRAAEQEQLKNMFGGSDLASSVRNATDRGNSVKVGDVTIGADPTARLVQQNQHGGAAAISKAQDIYNKRLPKYQDMASKMSEGLTAVNDPTQIGSAGAAKSMLISGVAGMSRYNQNEGSDLMPSSVLQRINQFANSLGADSNPLTDKQRASINALMVEGLKGLQKSHAVTKASALGAYQTSPYYDAAKGDALERSLGAPFDKQLNDQLEQYGKYGQQQPQMAPPQAQSGGMLDKLKSMFSMGSHPAQPQQSTPQPQQPSAMQTPSQTMRVVHKQSGQTGTIPANEYDPNVYDKVQ